MTRPSDWWSAEPTEPTQLTLEDFEKALEAIKNAPPDPCRLGRHIISAEAFRTPGYYRCTSCGAVVKTERKDTRPGVKGD